MSNYIVFNLYTEDGASVYLVPESVVKSTMPVLGKMTSELFDSLCIIDNIYLVKPGMKLDGEILKVYTYDMANC